MSETPELDEVSYSYKSSLIGAPWVFSLTHEGLRWSKGPRAGTIAYKDIKRMRLSFRPVTMLFERYRLEVWSEYWPRIEIVSASHKSMIEQEKQGAAFSAFVTELHRRVSSAGRTPRLTAGIMPVLYWAGVIVFGGMGVSIAALIVRALQTQAWTAAAFIVAAAAFFVWQAGTFFWRNRPGTYSPDKLPAYLLPR